MSMNIFFLLLSAIVWVVGVYETKKVKPSLDTFGIGAFLFLLQYVVLPWITVFVSWFIKVGADATVPVASYLQGLFITSIVLGIYWLSKVWKNYIGG